MEKITKQSIRLEYIDEYKCTPLYERIISKVVGLKNGEPQNNKHLDEMYEKWKITGLSEATISNIELIELLKNEDHNEEIKRDGMHLVRLGFINEGIFLIDLGHRVRHLIANDTPLTNFQEYAHWKYMNYEQATIVLNNCLLTNFQP